MQTSRAFETSKMVVMIESVSYTGSGFGSNENGEGVFFNQRLVEKVDLEMGDIVEAHAIPNYEDKRDVTPWRAIRVAAEKAVVEVSEANDVEVFVRTAAQLDGEVLDLLQDEEVAYWTSSDLADAADTDTTTVGNSCQRLFNRGQIARADVYGNPGQKHCSFLLWAENAERFK